jgi:hypothetical protein
MKSNLWYKHFSEDPDEQVGRYVEGVFDEKVLIVLPRSSWAYLDWMETELLGDVVGFFKKVEAVRTPENGDATNAYMNAIYFNYFERERKGLSRPEWLNPISKEDMLVFEDRLTDEE